MIGSKDVLTQDVKEKVIHNCGTEWNEIYQIYWGALVPYGYELCKWKSNLFLVSLKWITCEE